MKEDLRDACEAILPEVVMKAYGVLYMADINKMFNLLAVPSDIRVQNKR